MTQPQQTNKSGCGPLLAWGFVLFLALGFIGQACGLGDDDPSGYEPSPGCADAARVSSEANGFDYDSEYEACRQMETIIESGG